MNELENARYKDVRFTPELVDMYLHILEQDNKMKVFTFISFENQKQKKKDAAIGVTINDIVEHVQVHRRTRVKKQNRFKYEMTTTNIDRKGAELIVDKLLDMGLIYFVPKQPYKFLKVSERGIQVLQEAINRKSTKNKGAVDDGKDVYNK